SWERCRQASAERCDSNAAAWCACSASSTPSPRPWCSWRRRRCGRIPTRPRRSRCPRCRRASTTSGCGTRATASGAGTWCCRGAVARPGGAKDASVRATVLGVAQRFQKLTNADVFEVWDRNGRVLASVGVAASSAGDRERLMTGASARHEFTGLLAGPRAQWQIALVPVHADGVLVGALLLGSAVDASLASELQLLTRGEVTFAAGDAVIATSLNRPDDAL